MRSTVSRRMAVLGAVLLPFGKGLAQSEAVIPDWAIAPIGWPDQVPGAGFMLRHGFATENTWFAEGWWHTGEDWYAMADGETGGAMVFAVAAGEVVYADFDYPGRVVIVQHEDALYSVYGHLEPDSVPEVGARVVTGQQIGTVLTQPDEEGAGAAPSHLHFEVRTFLTEEAVNGNQPIVDVSCGVNCPPGPGYWPMDAGQHPSELGWRNPTLFALNRLAENLPEGLTLLNNAWPKTLTVHAKPDPDSEATGDLQMGGLTLLRIEADDADSLATGAEAYRAMFEVAIHDRVLGWVPAVLPTVQDVGSDGRPSAVERTLLIEFAV